MRSSVRPLVLVVALVAALTASAAPAVGASGGPPGDLDLTFGGGTGFVVADTDPGVDDVYTAAATYFDGRQVYAGYVTGTDGEFAVDRRLDDGSLDPAFGPGGRVLIDPGAFTAASVPSNVFVLPDDGVLVTATNYDDAGRDVFVAARLTATGALDPTYGTGGVLVIDVPDTDFGLPTLTALDAQGRLYAAHTTISGGTEVDCHIARFTESGTPDLSWGTGGSGALALTGGLTMCQSVAIAADDTLLVSADDDDDDDTAYVAKFDEVGALDPAFGTGGIASVTRDDYLCLCSMVVAVDGSILLGGLAIDGVGMGSTVVAVVVRLDASGAVDPGFGVGGWADLPPSIFSAGPIDVTPDGFVVGLSDTGEDVFALDRDGALVADFGDAGIIPFAADFSGGTLYDLTIDRFGRILTLGFDPCGCDAFAARFNGFPQPDPPVPPFPPLGQGYWLAARDGGIFSFGDAEFYGSTGGLILNEPVVGIAPTWSSEGYWLVASDGGIFSFGDAVFHGSTGGLTLNQPIVGMAATPTGDGYWLVAADGGIFSFGDAVFHGSTGSVALVQPIVGMAATPTGDGYWLVAADGGVFSFGDAVYHGSTGSVALVQPMVGLAATPTGDGYWLVAADGGIFSFGDAVFHGSTGGIPLNQPIVGMAATITGDGYWFVARDGGVFSFGDAKYHGSTGGLALNQPVVALTPAVRF